jgi:glycosyltransferase 2 family protein
MLEKKSRINWKALADIGKYVIAAVLIFFVVRVVVNGWKEFQGHTFSVRWVFIVISFLIGIVSYFLQAINWHLILRALGIQLQLAESATTWFYSMMAKYIPGKVFQLFGRILLLEKHKVSKKLIGVSFLIENAFGLIASGFYGAIFLIFRFTAGQDTVLRMSIAVGLFLVIAMVLISPRVLETLINFGLRIFKREPIKIKMSFGKLVAILVYYCFCLAVYGFSFIFFIMALDPTAGIHLYFWAISAFSLYSILNILAFFTPNGVGFGEISLLYLLKFFLTKAGTMAVSVTIRLFIVLIELASTGVMFLVDRIFFRKDFREVLKQGVDPGRK